MVRLATAGGDPVELEVGALTPQGTSAYVVVPATDAADNASLDVVQGVDREGHVLTVRLDQQHAAEGRLSVVLV